MNDYNITYNTSRWITFSNKMGQAPNCLLFGHDLLASNPRHVVELVLCQIVQRPDKVVLHMPNWSSKIKDVLVNQVMSLDTE